MGEQPIAVGEVICKERFPKHVHFQDGDSLRLFSSHFPCLDSTSHQKIENKKSCNPMRMTEDTFPKTHSSPLKIGRNPKGKDHLPATIFRGKPFVLF